MGQFSDGELRRHAEEALILDIAQREREPDIQHHRQADDLGAGLEPLERAGLGHGRTLVGPLPRLKPSSSDKTAQGLSAEASEIRLRIASMPSLVDQLVAKDVFGRWYVEQIDADEQIPILFLPADNGES